MSGDPDVLRLQSESMDVFSDEPAVAVKDGDVIAAITDAGGAFGAMTIVRLGRRSSARCWTRSR